MFSVVTVCGVCAQPSDIVGTMPEDYLPELKSILATALRRSPSTIMPLFEIEQRQAHRMKENANRLPSLAGNFSYGRTELSESGNNTSRSRDQGLQYNIGLGQPLFYWNALKNASTIANINVLLSQKNYARAYRDLGVLLRKRYLEMIVLKAQLQAQRESLRFRRQNLAVKKERLATGMITPAEVSGEELAIDELALALERSEAEALAVRRTFSRLAGVPELAEASIPEELPVPVYSETVATNISAALLRDGATKTIEAGIHDLRVREAQLRYNIEKVRLLPKFNFGAGYNLENTTTVGTSVGQRAVARQTLSITGSWNFFDGFATRAAKMEARAVQRLQKARRQADLEELMETAQALARQLQLDVRQLEYTEVHRALAVHSRQRVGVEAELGNASKSAVDRAQYEILRANASNVAARATFLARWSEFVAVAGEDPVLNNLPTSHVREK
jgi:outer membrane protein TolC